MKRYKNTDVLRAEWEKRRAMAEFPANTDAYYEGKMDAYSAVLADLAKAPEVDEETIYRKVKRKYLKEDIATVLEDSFDIDEPTEEMLWEIADAAENGMEWNLPAYNVIYEAIENYLAEHGY